MFYRLLADAIVIVHATYVLLVVGGLVAIIAGKILGWSAIRNFWFRTIHLGMITVVVAESLVGAPCPLTQWEGQLRELGGESGDSGTFVGNFVHAGLFYDLPEWAFTLTYCLFGLAVVALFVWVPPNMRWRGQASGGT